MSLTRNETRLCLHEPKEEERLTCCWLDGWLVEACVAYLVRGVTKNRSALRLRSSFSRPFTCHLEHQALLSMLTRDWHSSPGFSQRQESTAVHTIGRKM